MSKRNDITGVAIKVPESLVAMMGQDDSLVALREHKILPRLVTTQPLSKELKEKYGEGACVFPSMDEVVAKWSKTDNKGVRVNTLFFFNEYVKYSDRKDKGSSMILGRTFDPGSEIGRKAQDGQLWNEPYGQGYIARYVHHLIFLCRIDEPGSPLDGTVFALSFHRGNFSAGKGVATIAMKPRLANRMPAPLWAQQWILTCEKRENAKGEWFVPTLEWDCLTPEDKLKESQEQYLDAKEHYEARTLDVSHEEAEKSDSAGESSTDTPF